MCLFLITILLEPFHRLSAHRYRTKNHPYRHNNSHSSSSSLSLPPYPGRGPSKKLYSPGYFPHPLYPNRPAPHSGQPVLVQGPRVDRLIGVLNSNGLLGNAGANDELGIGMGHGGFDNSAGEIRDSMRGGLDGGNGINGDIGLQGQQDHIPRFGGIQSPRHVYAGRGLGGVNAGVDGLPYNDPRLGVGGIGRPGMDGMLGNRMFENSARPGMGPDIDNGGYQMQQPPLPQDYGYPGAQYLGPQYAGNFQQAYNPPDPGLQMGLQPMMPPQQPSRAELRGGRSLSPGYGMPADMLGPGIQAPYRQDLYAGYAQLPRQPLWHQGLDHIHNCESPPYAPTREEAAPTPRTFGLGGRTDTHERSERPFLGRAKPDKRSGISPLRGQEGRQHGDVQDEADRIFGEAAESKQGKQKERERTTMESPSRNPFGAFSRLQRRGEKERNADEERKGNESGGRRTFALGRPSDDGAGNGQNDDGGEAS